MGNPLAEEGKVDSLEGAGTYPSGVGRNHHVDEHRSLSEEGGTCPIFNHKTVERLNKVAQRLVGRHMTS